jgi:hypothetical protein
MSCATIKNPDSLSLWIAVASLLVSLAATWVAANSLFQAKRVADRDLRDWRQRKWFDLYLEASEVGTSIERFQATYDDSSLGTETFLRDRNELMILLRRMYSKASVFPQNPEVIALMKCAIGNRDVSRVLSKEFLTKFGDAIEGLRLNALVDTTVLD